MPRQTKQSLASRKKFLKLPYGLSAFKHSRNKKGNYLISLRITFEGPSFGVNRDNHQSQYRKALVWMIDNLDQTDLDPDAPFPYSWDEFLEIFELKSEMVIKEILTPK